MEEVPTSLHPDGAGASSMFGSPAASRTYEQKTNTSEMQRLCASFPHILRPSGETPEYISAC